MNVNNDGHHLHKKPN